MRKCLCLFQTQRIVCIFCSEVCSSNGYLSTICKQLTREGTCIPITQHLTNFCTRKVAIISKVIFINTISFGPQNNLINKPTYGWSLLFYIQEVRDNEGESFVHSLDERRGGGADWAHLMG